MIQLTVNQSLVSYGLIGLTAIGGLYNRAVLVMGMIVLFFISVVLTIFEIGD